MATSTDIDDLVLPTRMRRGIAAVLVLIVLIVTAISYVTTFRFFEAQAIGAAENQHALYLRSLNESIRQHQHLPFFLSENPLIDERLSDRDGASLNASLEEFAQAAALEAIYIMSLTGDVIAASNYQLDTSFLGQNYSFRPYFQEAAAGARSDYFAIGATTGRPGYFVAEPLQSESGDITGVVAIKLDVSELQASWEERGENVVATNPDGIVVLSANPDWLYRSIADLDVTRRNEIVDSRQFGIEPLAPLAWRSEDAGKLEIADASFYKVSGPTEIVDWTVHYLAPTEVVLRQTLLTTALLGAITAMLIGLAAYLRSQRIVVALEISQRQRRELITANDALIQAQDELERTSKLAALGQLASKVTHELGQPISALKNHVFAAEMGNEITSPETAQNLHKLTARMEAITHQLRFFSARTDDRTLPVDMKAAIEEALSLVRHDFDAAGLVADWTPPEGVWLVDGHQFQLEQAIVNLLRNALHAVEALEEPVVKVNLSAIASEIRIEISDNGPGLGDLVLDDLKEPFFSTKSTGMGMGLGLSITSEIIENHSGQLSAKNGPEGGAMFCIYLPMVEGTS